MQKNKKIYDEVKKIIKENKDKQKSISDGLFILALYKKGKNQKIESLINGLSLEEMDVAIRELYSRIYEMRMRNNKKMIKLNNKLKKK